jgi:hypothetical protein
MTPRVIKNLPDFYRKKEPGWTNGWGKAGLIAFDIVTLKKQALIPGGVSVFPLFDYKTRVGGLIIYVLQVV